MTQTAEYRTFTDKPYARAMLEVRQGVWQAASDRYDREPCEIHRKLEEARWNDYMTAKVELGLCLTANCERITDTTFCGEHAPDGAELS